MSPATALLATPHDAQELAQNGACACGHAALAAALCRPILDILPAFHRQGRGLWVDAHRMATAISLLTGERARTVPSLEAWDHGPHVLWIQGLGPWMDESLPAAARNERTHWISALNIEGDSWVYDIHHDDYLPKPVWERIILHGLLTHWKATGWEIRSAFTLAKP